MPRLILMCGLPGAGKTTVGARLASDLPALRLSPDEWLENLGFDGHDEVARRRVESLQWNVAQTVLRLGQNVILENGFWARAEREDIRVRARELGALVELRYLDVGGDEIWRRLEARDAQLPPSTFKVTRDQLTLWMKTFQPPNQAEMDLFDAPL